MPMLLHRPSHMASDWSLHTRWEPQASIAPQNPMNTLPTAYSTSANVLAESTPHNNSQLSLHNVQDEQARDSQAQQLSFNQVPDRNALSEAHAQSALGTAQTPLEEHAEGENADVATSSAHSQDPTEQTGSADDDEEMLEDGDESSEEGSAAVGESGREKTAAERLLEKKKMKRFRLTHNQTRYLMSEFARQAHPDSAQRERLSREIPGLTPRQVQVWFQNRRAKLKRLTVDDRDRMMRSRALPEGFDMTGTLRSPHPGTPSGASYPPSAGAIVPPKSQTPALHVGRIRALSQTSSVDGSLSPHAGAMFPHPSSPAVMSAPGQRSPASPHYQTYRRQTVGMWSSPNPNAIGIAHFQPPGSATSPAPISSAYHPVSRTENGPMIPAQASMTSAPWPATGLRRSWSDASGTHGLGLMPSPGLGNSIPPQHLTPEIQTASTQSYVSSIDTPGLQTSPIVPSHVNSAQPSPHVPSPGQPGSPNQLYSPFLPPTPTTSATAPSFRERMLRPSHLYYPRQAMDYSHPSCSEAESSLQERMLHTAKSPLSIDAGLASMVSRQAPTPLGSANQPTPMTGNAYQAHQQPSHGHQATPITANGHPPALMSDNGQQSAPVTASTHASAPPTASAHQITPLTASSHQAMSLNADLRTSPGYSIYTEDPMSALSGMNQSAAHRGLPPNHARSAMISPVSAGVKVTTPSLPTPGVVTPKSAQI